MSKQIDWSKAPEGATHFLHGSDEYSSCWLKYGFAISARNAYGSDKWISSGGSMRAIEEGLAIPRPTTPSWFGEGLPPVGVVCEVNPDKAGWRKSVISYIGNGFLAWLQVGDLIVPEYGAFIEDCEFRPIHTAEQIAADEREAAIKELKREMIPAYDAFAEPLLDVITRLGYRKP